MRAQPGDNAAMSMSDRTCAQLQIHFCVLLWGFTAILGKLIALPALPLVWWRMLLVVAVLALLPRVWRGLRALTPRLALAYAGIGVLVALHWLTFYGAIKLANASVAATCIALAPVFTAAIEPWAAQRPFRLSELALGVAVILGAVFLDPLLARRGRRPAAGDSEVQHPEVLGTSEAKHLVD